MDTKFQAAVNNSTGNLENCDIVVVIHSPGYILRILSSSFLSKPTTPTTTTTPPSRNMKFLFVDCAKVLLHLQKFATNGSSDHFVQCPLS